MKKLFSLLLTIGFGVLSFGAFIDGRKQALPIALVFGGFAIYSAVVLVGQIRQSKSTNQ